MKDYPCRSHLPFWKSPADFNSEEKKGTKKGSVTKTGSGKKYFLLIFFLFAGIFSLDFFLKYWAYHYVMEPIVILQTPIHVDFLIQCVTNRGGAWGMLSSFHGTLLIFRIGVVVALLAYLFCYGHSRKNTIFLTMIIAGAFGNVIDSIHYGFVIDMLHFVFWGNSYGIFNFADAMIFLGAFGLILPALGKHERAHAK